MTQTTSSRKQTILLTGGSLLLASVLAVAIFSTLGGPLHISGIQSASAQGNGNMTTMTGNQTGGNTTASGNQTSSNSDLAQGDPDGDGL
jgi:hypothetical protein